MVNINNFWLTFPILSNMNLLYLKRSMNIADIHNLFRIVALSDLLMGLKGGTRNERQGFEN